jgi:replicative DNA helicase
MALLKRRIVDNEIEERILTGLISSSVFLREIENQIKKDSFAIPFVKLISGWCIDYHKKYQKSPGENIRDIFNIEKANMKDEEQEIISDFLAKISSKINQQEFNVEYLKDVAKRYLKKRRIKESCERIRSFIELDRVEEAEKEMMQYKKYSKESSEWVDVLSEEEIKKYFIAIADKSSELFSMPGALGKMLGCFERGWLVGIMAPAKRGKTFWLIETAVQAMMERKNVVFISLEMDSRRVQNRLLKRLTAFGERTEDYLYPCFDCLKNQDDSCRKKERTNRVGLLDKDGDKPEFKRGMNYQPCTACRGKRDFSVGTWFTLIRRNEMKQSSTLKIVKGVRDSFGNSLRIKSYPAFSACISDIKSDIDNLFVLEEFIPDVIVIDYADILAPEDGRIIGRDRIDDTWKTLKNLAEERHCAVITASQSNRASFKKKYVEEIDIAEDIRKIANVDLMFSINQTPLEKYESTVRINIVARRDGDFDKYKSCLVLQKLEVGQVALDSEIVYDFREEERKEREKNNFRI